MHFLEEMEGDRLFDKYLPDTRQELQTVHVNTTVGISWLNIQEGWPQNALLIH
jgi:hypothetical protein